MWNYEKRLQYPINITQPNPKIAMIIMSQYGGPDGEAAASMRYLSQRYSTPYREIAGLLTDVGTSVLSERPQDVQHPKTFEIRPNQAAFSYLLGSKVMFFHVNMKKPTFEPFMSYYIGKMRNCKQLFSFLTVCTGCSWPSWQ